MAALSEGYVVAPGSWSVPIGNLSNLQITVPAAPNGRFEVLITLLTADGEVLSEVKSTLLVSTAESQNQTSAPAAAAQSGVPSQSLSEAPPQASAMAPEDRALALRLLQRGDEKLAEGNVVPARLLYERAVELGLAQAAMALAATYDPAELLRLNVQGIAPDSKEARRWYERAHQLGADEAVVRLRRLATNPN